MRRMGAMVLVGGLMLALAGCGGGGSNTSAPVTVTVTTADTTPSDTTATAPAASDSGQLAVTAESCDTLRGIIDDLRYTQVDGSLNYAEDAAAMDDFADHVQVPDEVADSVATFRAVVDRIAAVYQDAGVAPNETPLPDQLDKINENQASADEARATQTLDAWTSNDCSG